MNKKVIKELLKLVVTIVWFVIVVVGLFVLFTSWRNGWKKL